MDRDLYNSYNNHKKSISMKTPNDSLNIFAKVFVATFLIIFVLIVVAIVKYTSKINIDPPKESSESSIEDVSGYMDNTNEEQKTIDKRLIMLQQEENAPSEAKIIQNDKQKNNDEIIDPKHIEDIKKYEKTEKFDKENSKLVKKEAPLPEKTKGNVLLPVTLPNEQNHSAKALKPHIKTENYEPESNITIMSRVLVGKFQTFEDAQKLQRDIKESNPASSPYVKKVSEVYTVQMGSYKDFSVAKSQASALKAKGWDVWIFQQ